MGRFVALLRGVNVGANKRVPMAEWRALLGTLGCTEVQTLLNSGNAVFTSRIRSTATLAQRIHESLQQGLKVDVPVVVKSADEFAAIEADNELAAEALDPSRLLVAFAEGPPGAVEPVRAGALTGEAVARRGRALPVVPGGHPAKPRGRDLARQARSVAHHA
jgi:uncharacterized protein (DUF1697 family)